MTLLHDRLCGGIRLSSQFWLVNLKVEPFRALAACNEFGFANSDAHRNASSCIALTIALNSRIAEINSDCAASSRQSHGTTKTS